MDNAIRRVRGKNKKPTAAMLASEAAFLERLAELGAVLLEPGYLGSQAKHHVRCAVGHDCYPRPNCLRSGQGPCLTCAGQNPALAAEAFRDRLAEIGATLLEPEWLGAMRKHHVRCKAGHDCYPKPNWVQQGRGICRTCAGVDPVAAGQAFRARLAELGAELLEPYTRSNDPHRVRCAAGHEGHPRPADVAKGDGICRTCAGKDPATAEARFLSVLEKLGAVPLYEKWSGSDKRYPARCNAGHECNPRPADAFRWGTICTVCTGKNSAVSEANFRRRLAELGATPLYETWHSANEQHHVRCARGHDCFPRPSTVGQGHGICRTCAGMVWDAFYVVTGNETVKFGITSGDPRPRLRIHAAQGFVTVVRLVTELPGTVAHDAENAIRAALALADETPVRGREYFSDSCLALVLDVADAWLSAAEAPPAVNAAEIAVTWVQEELFAA